MINFLKSWMKKQTARSAALDIYMTDNNYQAMEACWLELGNYPESYKAYPPLQLLCLAYIVDVTPKQFKKCKVRFPMFFSHLMACSEKNDKDEERLFLQAFDVALLGQKRIFSHHQQLKNLSAKSQLIQRTAEWMVSKIQHEFQSSHKFLSQHKADLLKLFDSSILLSFALSHERHCLDLMTHQDGQFVDSLSNSSIWRLLMTYPSSLRVIKLALKKNLISKESTINNKTVTWTDIKECQKSLFEESGAQLAMYKTLLSQWVATTFLYETELNQSDRFSLFFDRGKIAQCIAKDNFDFLKVNANLMVYQITQELIAHWLLLSQAMPDQNKHVLDVLSMILQHGEMRRRLLHSGLLNIHSGLSCHGVINEAKNLLHTAISDEQHLRRWLLISRHQPEIISALYSTNLVSFSHYATQLKHHEVNGFWYDNFDVLPKGGHCVLACVAILSGNRTVTTRTRQTDKNEEVSTPNYLNLKSELMAVITGKVKDCQGLMTPITNLTHAVKIILSDEKTLEQLALNDTEIRDCVVYIANDKRIHDWDEIIATHPHLLDFFYRSQKFKVLARNNFPMTNISKSLVRARSSYLGKNSTASIAEQLIMVKHPLHQCAIKREAEDKGKYQILCEESLLYADLLQPDKNLIELSLEDDKRFLIALLADKGNHLKKQIVNCAIEFKQIPALLSLISKHPKLKDYITFFCLDVERARDLSEGLKQSIVDAYQANPRDYFAKVYRLRDEVKTETNNQVDLLEGIKPTTLCNLLALRALNKHHKSLYQSQLNQMAEVLVNCQFDFSDVLVKYANDADGANKICRQLFDSLSDLQQTQLLSLQPIWNNLLSSDYPSSSNTSHQSSTSSSRTSSESVSVYTSASSSPMLNARRGSELEGLKIENLNNSNPDMSTPDNSL